MRILVDNSGYHLLNLGDISMLQATAARLRSLWPAASIEVITYSEERLALYCPGARPVGAGFLTHPLIRHLPRKVRYGLVQLHKILLPLLFALLRIGKRPSGVSAQPGDLSPVSLWDALVGADLIVASGGGYITDSFKLHGIGVLSLLQYAQRVGKPSAMFGQGIGPLRPGFVRNYALRVLPGVDIIALREGQFGPELLRSLGVDSNRIIVTGDDAVHMAYTARAEKLGDGLGINLRIAHYAGVDPAIADGVKTAIQEAARHFSAVLVPVPISLYEQDSDNKAIDLLVAGYEGEVDRGVRVDTPQKAIQQVGKCRALVTGSYHAAVYALAQGVQAVCLTHSPYYDYKFAGLVHLYPEACQVISLADPGYRQALVDAIEHAWVSAGARRRKTLLRALDQSMHSQEVYQLFAMLSGQSRE
jgi:colanic acid/amylovoran biosynthesis protein